MKYIIGFVFGGAFRPKTQRHYLEIELGERIVVTKAKRDIAFFDLDKQK